MERPVSIKLFGMLFGITALVGLMLAFYAARTTSFGFAMTPEAAATLTKRILAIRGAGFAIAVWLMLAVLFQRSRAARGALGFRWVLGVATSVQFLRGIGMVTPLGSGSAILAVATAQIAIEGLAILLLYSEDASEWFEVRLRF